MRRKGEREKQREVGRTDILCPGETKIGLPPPPVLFAPTRGIWAGSVCPLSSSTSPSSVNDMVTSTISALTNAMDVSSSTPTRAAVALPTLARRWRAH